MDVRLPEKTIDRPRGSILLRKPTRFVSAMLCNSVPWLPSYRDTFSRITQRHRCLGPLYAFCRGGTVEFGLDYFSERVETKRARHVRRGAADVLGPPDYSTSRSRANRQGWRQGSGECAPLVFRRTVPLACTEYFFLGNQRPGLQLPVLSLVNP